MIESSQGEIFQKFKPIFYPESIAIVGTFQNEWKVSYGWVKALIDTNFSGNIYPVNSRGGELLGLKVYHSLTAIPETIDYVIASVSRETTPNLLDECIAKKIKAIHFFTAGFSELDDSLGHELEEELVRKAQQGDFHIIGPNCIGTYCAEGRVPYGPRGIIGEDGPVGFISQSGGIANKLMELGPIRGIKYNKGVSFGNGIDLDSTDFLEYMAADPKITIIGAYLEGSRNGRRLLNTIRETTRTKPVIIWKGGRTEVGITATKSHTGSLASSAATWSAVLKQAGAIEVHSVEELTDTLLIFQQLHRWQGEGIAIVSGLANGGGGISVSASDTCAELGLSIPPLSSSTRQQLSGLLGQVGSILHNPIDVGQYGGQPSTLKETLDIILADPIIDLVLIQQDIGIILSLMPEKLVEDINNVFIDFRTKQNKPIVIVLPPGDAEMKRLRIEQRLCQAAIPVFPSMERAAKAIMNISKYSRFQTTITNQ